MTIFKLVGSPDPGRPEERLRVQVFAGTEAGALQLTGSLVLTIGEWQHFACALMMGADRMGDRLQVELVDPLAEPAP